MRVLFTTLAASGHLHPLVPVARALATAGHEVAVACAEEGRATVERQGFRFFPAGVGIAEARAALSPTGPDAPPAPYPLFDGREAFGNFLPRRMLPGLLAAAEVWQPDLIVRDATEIAGLLAAELLGLPHASVEVGVFLDIPFLADFVGDHLARLRAELGLPPDPDLTALYRHLHLSFAPPSYQDPARPLPATAVALRPVPFDRSGPEALPAWVDQLPPRPTVYATLGTVFNGDLDLLQAILAGLHDLPVNVVATVGRDGDPAALGPQPAHVRVEQYVPQSLLLPRCAAVVCHAGWNTVMAALGHGLPLVLMPIGADQPDNAERCRRLGVARVLAPEDRTPAAIGAAARAVLTEPGYWASAERLRVEMAALPGPDRAVPLLEELVARSRRLLAALTA
jgi:UDP:flavonoid glycosyltransferase YjiC (YdhE family)